MKTNSFSVTVKQEPTEKKTSGNHNKTNYSPSVRIIYPDTTILKSPTLKEVNSKIIQTATIIKP
jgi:hypothetical protein